MLHKVSLALSAAAVLAMPVAATAHPFSHIPNAVGTGHPAPPRTGPGPQAGGGTQCKPHYEWVIVDGLRRLVWKAC